MARPPRPGFPSLEPLGDHEVPKWHVTNLKDDLHSKEKVHMRPVTIMGPDADGEPHRLALSTYQRPYR
jgi:hypothetical protein